MSDPEALDLFSELDGVELIQKTPLFRSLGFEETRKLAALVRVDRFERGHAVLEQDSLGSALYILRTGEVEVVRNREDGSRQMLTRLGAGELFGEMSLIDDVLVSADVIVVSDHADVLTIPRGAFDDLMEADEHFALLVYRAFCQTLAGRLREMSRRFTAPEAER